MKRPIKLRFHLAKGENFQKWQLKHRTGIEYFDPEKVNIFLLESKLVNQRKTAERIHNGADKDVCAWVQAMGFEVRDVGEDIERGQMLRFNPEFVPHWIAGEGDNAKDVDGFLFRELVTVGRHVFVSTRTNGCRF